MHRFCVQILLAALLAGCASRAPAPVASERRGTASSELSQFSGSHAGDLPPGWAPIAILRDKQPTQYRLVQDSQDVVLHASAHRASSGLMYELAADPVQRPWLQWRWKIKGPQLLGKGSPAERGSPARIVLGFDGDKDSLPFTEQILFETARVVTGHEFPYATLMYVWSEDLPPASIVQSRFSGRIRMIVVDSGADGLDQWRGFSRNIAEDYHRAFGEPPGRLIGVGVLTDDEHTPGGTEAWYGDIRLTEAPTPASAAAETKPQSLFLTQSE
ncbi:MAG TPA: DUF3047 domain-containing protein [Noviherbaspirillum sp.]|nr:DUF3047 domain-containing protein [Noviherbaspirillum sp.]